MEKDVENNISEEDLRLYFGKNADTYIDYWKAVRLKMPNIKYSRWHWPGFFASIFWILYRKIYTVAFITLFCVFGLGVLIEFLDLPTSFSDSLDNIIGISLSAALALKARDLALWHAYKKITEINRLDLDTKNRNDLIKSKGGTSWLAVIIALVILIPIILFGLYLTNNPTLLD